MNVELAKRAVACKHWQWLPGVLTLPFCEDDDRSLPECHPPWRVRRPGIAGPWARDPTWGALPDLDDPATLGCLLALVREAWGAPRMAAWQAPEGHWVVVGIVPVASGATEAEALVAALEAAP